MSPGSSTESYLAFARIGLRKTPEKPQPGNLPRPGFEPGPPGFAARRADRYSTGVDSNKRIGDNVYTECELVRKIWNEDFLVGYLTTLYQLLGYLASMRFVIVRWFWREEVEDSPYNTWHSPYGWGKPRKKPNQINRHSSRESPLFASALHTGEPFEISATQPSEMNEEKKKIYEPTIQYLPAKYNIEKITVTGLFFGARHHSESLCKVEGKIQDLQDAIVTTIIKFSVVIFRQHLYGVHSI
ncbi:hypothetical protein ANN_16167 [Periplaneta americana]|uniref:Uncharacterized protein n=1 Tax=Periplaneta americana TaxID=6978 RepID=A0ABQ8SI81_PERAM|nr:hypothetical protein ANN_16167 [Periplaneta americana]